MGLHQLDLFFSGALGLSKKQANDFGLLMHVLYSNPKVLYAPNNTQADDVISKVPPPCYTVTQ